MGIPVWYSTNEINARFLSGNYRCPACGEYGRCAVTGYGNYTSLMSVLALGRNIQWRRVCCACGQGEKISKADAKEAAIKYNAWPEYIKAVRNTGLRNIGYFIAAMALLFLALVLSAELTPIHSAEAEELSSLRSSAKVQFAEVYPVDYYAYQTDENDQPVSYSFLCLYYDSADILRACSVTVEASDDAVERLLAFAKDSQTMIGDLALPVYGVVAEFDPEMQGFYEDGVEYLSEYMEIEPYTVDISYVSPSYEPTEPVVYLAAVPFLLLGLGLLAVYYIRYNPDRPPKSKEKALGEL